MAVAAAQHDATINETTTHHEKKVECKPEEAAAFQYGLGLPFSSVDDILNSEYSTVDRFITLSALLGRLFWPVPLPDHHPHAVALALAEQQQQQQQVSLQEGATTNTTKKQQKYQQKRRLVEWQEQLLALQNSSIYKNTVPLRSGHFFFYLYGKRFQVIKLLLCSVVLLQIGMHLDISIVSSSLWTYLLSAR